MQGSFGGETFTFSLFLVLCNRLTTMTVALSMLLVRLSLPLLPLATHCALVDPAYQTLRFLAGRPLCRVCCAAPISSKCSLLENC